MSKKERYPKLIKEARLNSLAIYDTTDPIVVIVVTIREIIMNILCEYLEQSKFLFRKDTKIIKENFRKRFKKKLDNEILAIGVYLKVDGITRGYYDITEDLLITVRVLYKGDLPLYVPTEVRYYYGDM